MFDPGIIVGLFVIIGLLVYDRWAFADREEREKKVLLEELSRATKAVIAKNANDYVMTTSIDKVPRETAEPVDPDLVQEESLSDDQFMEAIGKRVKDK